MTAARTPEEQDWNARWGHVPSYPQNAAPGDFRCEICGREHDERTGIPLPRPQQVVYVTQPQRPRTWLGTVALVLGLLGFVSCGFTAFLAVIFGHVGLAEARKNPRREGRENALAGLILGYVLLGAWVGFWALGFGASLMEGGS